MMRESRDKSVKQQGERLKEEAIVPAVGSSRSGRRRRRGLQSCVEGHESSLIRWERRNADDGRREIFFFRPVPSERKS
jgi:hypothetical protein